MYFIFGIIKMNLSNLFPFFKSLFDLVNRLDVKYITNDGQKVLNKFKREGKDYRDYIDYDTFSMQYYINTKLKK